jgi:iron complex transport system substrate-binding protein
VTGRSLDGSAVSSIVSLLPSATEWVFALGLQHRLAGVTFECDEPAGARTDHAVVVTGLETAGLTPGEIDALVRSTLAAGRPMYRLDSVALQRISPDVVLTQDLCGVCALPASEVVQAMDAVGCPGAVVTLDPHTLAEVLAGARAVADAAGAGAAGVALEAALRRRLDVVADRVRHRPAPRVLVLEWSDPPFVAGHWLPDLVTAAGGVPVLAVPAGRSVTTTWAEVAAAEADVVVVAPCGYGLDDAALQARDVLDRLPAGAQVWAIDAGGLVTRPGPRVVDGVEALAAALHAGAATTGATARIR